MTHGHPVPVTDLFGTKGRLLLASLAIPDPWATSVTRSLELLDELEHRVEACEREIFSAGRTHPYVPLLVSAPGIGTILGAVIAAEIGDITRFRSAKAFVGYTGLCPFVRQSGSRDSRGPLAKNGPKYLRWALVEAAIHAARTPAFRSRYLRTRKRLGRQRGSKVARIEVARDLATAIWHMLTKSEPFAPAGPAVDLVA
jgi:transposase